MEAVDMPEYRTILAIVRAWPPAQRLMLIRDVLQTLAQDSAIPHPGRATLSRALGLLAIDQPPPSDSEVARWLDERRDERYSTGIG